MRPITNVSRYLGPLALVSLWLCAVKQSSSKVQQLSRLHDSWPSQPIFRDTLVMSGVGEASLVLGIISSIIAIVTAAKNIYDAANDTSGLPKAFHKVVAKLPMVVVILRQADEYIHISNVDQDTRDAFTSILRRCDTSAKELHGIFNKVIPREGSSRVERYVSAAKKIGQGGRVEDLMAELLKEIGLLLASSSFASQKMLQSVEGALADVSLVEPSLPASFTAVPLTRVKTLHQLQYNEDSDYPRNVHPHAFLLEWLIPKSSLSSDRTIDHEMYLRKRFRNPETGYTSSQWFFETPTYRKFSESESSKILKIKGSPGCGKSILMAAAIHALETAETASRTLFWYCSRDAEETNSMILVRSLLAQTLEWATPEMVVEVKKFQSAHAILKAPDVSVEEGLWRLLRTVLGLRTEKTYIVVDGLDECTQPLMCARHLIRVTTSLATKSHCGLLLSSRLDRRDVFENKGIQSSLMKNEVECCEMEITLDLVQRDLKEFVSFQVLTQPSFQASSEPIREKIIASICERSQGMFLFASLAIEDLEGGIFSSIADINSALANLPADLFKSFERKLDIPRQSRKGSESIRWIFSASPSLTWQELKSALIIEEGGRNESEVILDSCDSFVHHSCGQLVESFGSSEYMRFIHPSVTDFLISWTERGTDFDIPNASSMVASKLLTFLNYPDLPAFSSPVLQPPELTIREYTARPARGIYAFAVSNWFHYLKVCVKTQDPKMERQVLQFLESKSFIRWLKTAIIMSRISRDGRDSASLTADVVDSLQSWMLGRSWTSGNLESKVQMWIKHFLEMMLDWGKVIETQPDWIHYLHSQLLSSTSIFRDTLEESESDQSIVQFVQEVIKTRHSEPITWPDHCIAIDFEKNLAFTYDESFLACYHIKTGLSVAEIDVPVPPKVHGPLAVRRGSLSSNGKYLAVVLEALGPLADPVGSKIRAGRRLLLNPDTTGFKWGLDDASTTFDLSGCLANMAIGVDGAEFVVLLLELNHTGPARTHLLRPPKWATTPVLVTGTQTMRWDLADVDILQFSDDSKKLLTAFGTFDLESGTNVKRWQFALSQFYEGGKVTGDSKTMVTVLRDPENDCIVQFFDIEKGSNQGFAHQELRYSGIVHLLAVSEHGRFLLLTKREISQDSTKAKSRKSSLSTQQASIGIFDCRDGEWTPLLLLDREFVNRLPHWNFLPYNFQPRFGREASEEGEVNKVFLCTPPGWKLSGNVRKSRALNPGKSHLLLFESKQSVKGFGKNPSLKLQLHTDIFSPRNSDLDNSVKFLGWDTQLNMATIYLHSAVTKLNHEELKSISLEVSKDLDVRTNIDDSAVSSDIQTLSSLLLSSTGSATFHVQASITSSATTTTHSTTRGGKDLRQTFPFLNTYNITISCLLSGEEQARSYSVTHSNLASTNRSWNNDQCASALDEGLLYLGSLELQISHGYEDMSIIVKDPGGESMLQRAKSCFNSRAHPLAYGSLETSIVRHVDGTSGPRYIIFGEAEVESEAINPPKEESENDFIMNGGAFSGDGRHVFQVSRKLRKDSTGFEDKEAGRFEVCLFVYNEDMEDIIWMTHTTSGGDISGSLQPLPEIGFAFHEDLSLLAWILPGHRLRLSNVESHAAPITIAESVVLDVDSAHAISFSSGGRYLMIQGQEGFKNDLMNLRKSSNLWGLILCDLQEGKSIGAALISEFPVTFDVGDQVLHTYRLTREGAIEDTTYGLPGLILIQRQYLTFIAAGCCCSTCGKSFESQCHVSVVEHEGGIMAILGHTRIGLGRAPMSKDVCQPLMIRVTTPPVDLNIGGIQESVFAVSSTRLFPAVLSGDGEILDDAFAARISSRGGCIRLENTGCLCRVCSLQAAETDKSIDITWIPQMETKISDFKLASGLAVPPEQIEELHCLAEKAGTNDTCVWEISRNRAEDAIMRMKGILGDEVFPWDSWTEFKEAMEEIKDVFNIHEYTKRMFEPGHCGIGCQIPLFVHTFHFGERDKPNDFHWSSSTTVGWLEEDLAWYYERAFGGAFEGERRWYDFPAYKSLSLKMHKLQQDKTAKGKRFRKYFGSGLDKKGKPLEIELPDKDKDGKHVFVKDGVEYTDEMKPMVTGLIMKDIFDSMSDLVPGLGKVFEMRMHTMFEQSLIEDLLD
ncbi:hypothetical protein VTL71DRAFT_2156 [Oculimacula yallundae]|uniref:NACHT domain-containing protein n=1 Tax=Oculimacula yallundae TaxID=86028 RepID=A0ABR4C8M2_9HELO